MVMMSAMSLAMTKVWAGVAARAGAAAKASAAAHSRAANDRGYRFMGIPPDVRVETGGGRRKTCGFRPAPTPGGVPVRMTSPGSRVMQQLAKLMIRFTPKIIVRVFPSWKRRPFTRKPQVEVLRVRDLVTPASDCGVDAGAKGRCAVSDACTQALS